MITVITLGYIALVMVALKVINIKVSPTSIATAVVIGSCMLGAILVGWKFSAPMSGKMVVFRRTIPLLSGQDSKEFISKVHVEQDQPVTKGTLLWETDKRPNQYAVDTAAAQLELEKQNILQLQAALDVATESVKKAKASEAYQKAALDTAVEIQTLDSAAIAALKVKVQQETYVSSQAAVEQALAAEKEAQFALTSAQDALKATEAALDLAKFNLSQNEVRAPADGYVMNMQAIEGTMTTTILKAAQGVFMDMSETLVAAVFPQNLLANVQPGDAVEIAFKNMPGKIATGKVDAVLEYSGEGQFITTPQLPVVADLGSQGQLVVRITLDDQELAKTLPLGGAGDVAIYTQTGEPFHRISKITMRIKMWMNYAPI